MTEINISISQMKEKLASVGYLADDYIATSVVLANRLSKPVLVEGPAGTGKTELAKATATAFGMPLIRLQCYEGLDEAKALYEWDYAKQLLAIQIAKLTHIDDSSASDHLSGGPGSGEKEVREKNAFFATDIAKSIFSEDFLLPRPLLQAIRAPEQVVLLIDEVDRIDVEIEALFLEILSDYQVSIPELGTIKAANTPLVFLTSNDTRDLSEALKRRCLYLHLDYPSREREAAIIRSHLPNIDEHLLNEITRFVGMLREMDLEKPPSISEALDYANALIMLSSKHITDEAAKDIINVLLKYIADIRQVKLLLDTKTDKDLLP